MNCAVQKCHESSPACGILLFVDLFSDIAELVPGYSFEDCYHEGEPN